jgi:hypothetical protein
LSCIQTPATRAVIPNPRQQISISYTTSTDT